jgi:hypothetical protein
VAQDISDLGLLCPIMIAKVPEALWTIAVKLISVSQDQGHMARVKTWLTGQIRRHISVNPWTLHLPGTTPNTPSLPTSVAQPQPIPILLPAENRQACQAVKAITPMHHLMIMVSSAAVSEVPGKR